MRIAVLGGGYGTSAAAADLAEQGREIRLWRRDATALAPLIESPAIALKDSRGRRSVNIALAIPDVGAAIHGAKLIAATARRRKRPLVRPRREQPQSRRSPS